MGPESIVATLALALGASWCAGLNLYATVAVLGLMHRYVGGFQLPEHLELLASNWVLFPALVMYCAEFLADKIPGFDTVWDGIHTFIRIPAGAALAAASFGDVPPEVQFAAALVGGTLAFGSHAVKASTRIASHSTGTSPLVSPAASLVEDGLVIGTLTLAAVSPMVSIGLTVLMIVVAALLLKAFWTIFKRLIASFSQGRRSPSLQGAGTRPPAAYQQ